MDKTFNKAFKEYKYLFVESGIPLFVEHKDRLQLVGDKVQTILSKMIFLTYQMAKDIKETRVDIITSADDKKELIQINIRGLKRDSIDFYSDLTMHSGVKSCLADYWHEVEQSFGSRQARVVIFDNTEAQGTTIQVSLAKIQERQISANA